MVLHYLRRLWLFILLIPVSSALGQNRFILNAPAASLSTIAANHGLTLLTAPNAEGVVSCANSDTRTSAQVIAELKSDPAVLDIEGDGSASVPEPGSKAQLSPTIPSSLAISSATNPINLQGVTVWSAYENQTAVTLTNLNAALSIPANGSGTVVAIIDTGVDPNHPVLRGSLVPGYDFVNNLAGIPSEWSDLDPATTALLSTSTAASTSVLVNQSTAAILDQSTAAILDVTKLPVAFGHGTMVAGIINLVAPNAQIMPLKAFKGDGTANLSDIVRAIYYAVDNGARVINMSFSMSSLSLELMKAVNYASDHGVVCVASVGNQGAETMVYPAGFQNVIGVASTDNLDNRSTFSNFGEALVRISAPGEGIVTCYPGGGYAVGSGTSFAAPFVSGGASLMVQRDYDLTQDEASLALSHAKKLTRDLGWGRLDLGQSVSSLTPVPKPIH